MAAGILLGDQTWPPRPNLGISWAREWKWQIGIVIVESHRESLAVRHLYRYHLPAFVVNTSARERLEDSEECRVVNGFFGASPHFPLQH